MRSGSSEACSAQKPAARPPRSPWSFLTRGEDPCLACLSGQPRKFSLFPPLRSEQPFVVSLDCLEKNHSWNCLEFHEWCLEDKTLKDTILLKVRLNRPDL